MSTARGVVFDFNGTLSHDEPLLYGVYRDMFSDHGRPLTETDYYGTLAGLSAEAIIGRWLTLDRDELTLLVEERVARYLALAGRGNQAAASRMVVRTTSAGSFSAPMRGRPQILVLMVDQMDVAAHDQQPRNPPNPAP